MTDHDHHPPALPRTETITLRVDEAQITDKRHRHVRSLAPFLSSEEEEEEEEEEGTTIGQSGLAALTEKSERFGSPSVRRGSLVVPSVFPSLIPFLLQSL